MSKQAKSKAGKTPTVNEALHNGNVMGALSKGAGSAESKSNIPSLKAPPPKDLTKAAKQDAELLAKQNATVAAGIATIRDQFIQRALWLREPEGSRAVLNDDGMSAKQQMFLDLFKSEFRALRSVPKDKPDAYSNTATSEYKTIVIAVQHGGGHVVDETYKGADGKNHVRTVKLESGEHVAKYLGGITNWRTMLAQARKIRGKTRFASNKGKGKNAKTVKPQDVPTMLTKALKGKIMDAHGIVMAQRWLAEQAMPFAKALGNEAFFAKSRDDWFHHLVKSIARDNVVGDAVTEQSKPMTNEQVQHHVSTEIHGTADNAVPVVPQLSQEQMAAAMQLIQSMIAQQRTVPTQPDNVAPIRDARSPESPRRRRAA